MRCEDQTPQLLPDDGCEACHDRPSAVPRLDLLVLSLVAFRTASLRRSPARWEGCRGCEALSSANASLHRAARTEYFGPVTPSGARNSDRSALADKEVEAQRRHCRSPAHPLGLDKLLLLHLLHPLRPGTGGAGHSEYIFYIHGACNGGSALAVGCPPPNVGNPSTAVLLLESPLEVR